MQPQFWLRVHILHIFPLNNTVLFAKHGLQNIADYITLHMHDVQRMFDEQVMSTNHTHMYIQQNIPP